MVVDRGLVRGMEIVGQDVEPIQILVQLGHIVALVNVLDASWHSHGQQQPGATGLLCLALELGTQLLHELCIVIAISRLATLTVCRVLPVQIDAIKVILTQELQYVLDELLTTIRAGHEGREAGRGLVPAADGNHRFQLLVVRFQSREFRIAT